ncbi:multicopper oxidase domain-containing protein [Rhizomonospora bruguierae]|uniref:multicopper oxidase domain-containing protein n=1 Tax=Rhizomonospora bruguierae TaxID=1581705 RepID=UPI0020BEBD07|nr:multicopper oxidase domain-containing protein [Micromonospora sp. NBRC 107566]
MTRPATVAARVPLVAAGGLALLAGLYAALLLLGFALPVPRPALADVHGPVMVLGFVGTLIALERAVALGTRWALAAPACTGAGALVLIAAGPTPAGKLLLAAGGVSLLAVYRALWRRQGSVALLAQIAGAFAWYAATLLWLAGLPIPDLVPWLATFVVATIAGERLELAHVALAGPRPRRWFLAALATLVAGATAATLWPAAGAHLFGAGLLAVVAWLAGHDVARRTVHARGLPRYVAVGLLTGYAWLALAGVLWSGAGRTAAGARYDATLHAVFLGFTMSMIFVHAPVILPAVLRRPLPYRPVLYAPLALLHGSLLIRVAAGDGAGWEPVWRWTGAANVAAVAGFAACAAVLSVRAARHAPHRRPRHTPAMEPAVVGPARAAASARAATGAAPTVAGAARTAPTGIAVRTRPAENGAPSSAPRGTAGSAAPSGNTPGATPGNTPGATAGATPGGVAARSAPGQGAPGTAGGAQTGRAGWHRRAGLLPLGYLAGIVVVAFAHPMLAQWRWLAIHLLLLGAVSNAIVIWSAHFTAAVLRVPAGTGRRGETLRLALLNAGVLAVLAGGALDRPWVGVGGAAAVFAAICAHLSWLRTRLRAALPARFGITVRYYLAGAVALLTGIPAGAWMLVTDDGARARLILFHAHVNLLGWVTLTVLGTALTLWPTILRTRMADGAVAAARTALPTALVGLVLLAVGVLGWWPVLAVGGLAITAVAAGIVILPAVRAARGKPPSSFAAWSLAAAGGWLLAALAIDAATLATAAGPDRAVDRFPQVLVPLLVGFAAQTLLGALTHLLPVALGGGPSRVRAAIAKLDRHGAQRVATANAALGVYLLPVPPYVRITTSLLVLAALVQFLIPAFRLILTRRQPVPATTAPADPTPAATPPPAERSRPLGGVAGGVALVLVAVLVGVAAQRVTDPAAGSVTAAAPVAATGHTTTVAVTADGMRFHPDRFTVPAGDRLVIEVTNRDSRRHDLVLATGAKTGTIGRGGTARLDAGIIGGTVEGWCSLPGHRQAGMTITVTTTGDGGQAAAVHDHGGAPAPDGTAPRVDAMLDPGPGFTARDATAPAATTDRVHKIELHVREVVREVAPGVRQRLWTFNGTAPGPTLRGRIGDTFEITLVNDGSIDHGIDFHAGALAPDVPMRPIDPGQRLTYRFTAAKAGIWMYHCSTMPMLLHIGNGMYGAVIIDPPDLTPVDREYVLVQSEFYLGPDGQPGDLTRMQAEQPDAVTFNGYTSQYVHRPLGATAGQRVRVWVLDAGPNRPSAFHIVGAQFDTVYREGHYDLRPGDPGGAQVLDLAPAAGGFVETVLPEPGHYPFVSHVMVDADRGARGVLDVRRGRP